MPIALAAHFPLQPFELLLCLAIIAGIGYRVALTIGIEGVQPHINPRLFAGGNMLNLAGGSDTELAVVAIRATNEPHPLDLLHGKGLDSAGANQAQAPDAQAIGEGDVLSVRFEFPARHLVFDASAIMLEPRITLLARLLLLAVVIEALHGMPCALGTGLTRLGTEFGGKGKLLRQHRCVGAHGREGLALLGAIHPRS